MGNVLTITLTYFCMLIGAYVACEHVAGKEVQQMERISHE